MLCFKQLSIKIPIVLYCNISECKWWFGGDSLWEGRDIITRKYNTQTSSMERPFSANAVDSRGQL